MCIMSNDSPTNKHTCKKEPCAIHWPWVLMAPQSSSCNSPAAFPSKNTNKIGRPAAFGNVFASVQSSPGLHGPVCACGCLQMRLKALFIVTAVSVSGVNVGLVPCRYRACDLAPCLQLASSAPLSATTQHVFFTVRTSRFGF